MVPMTSLPGTQYSGVKFGGLDHPRIPRQPTTPLGDGSMRRTNLASFMIGANGLLVALILHLATKNQVFFLWLLGFSQDHWSDLLLV